MEKLTPFMVDGQSKESIEETAAEDPSSGMLVMILIVLRQHTFRNTDLPSLTLDNRVCEELQHLHIGSRRSTGTILYVSHAI